MIKKFENFKTEEILDIKDYPFLVEHLSDIVKKVKACNILPFTNFKYDYNHQIINKTLYYYLPVERGLDQHQLKQILEIPDFVGVAIRKPVDEDHVLVLSFRIEDLRRFGLNL